MLTFYFQFANGMGMGGHVSANDFNLFSQINRKFSVTTKFDKQFHCIVEAIRFGILDGLRIKRPVKLIEKRN